MSHYGSSNQRVRNTPPEWIPLARTITNLVNEWSQRDDLIAYVGENAGRGRVSALFDPYIGEIEVDIFAAFGKDITPSELGDLEDRDNQFNWPKGVGAILHEAMHAKFTDWDLKDSIRALSENENDALHDLEESRIEKLGVALYPQNREFFRACALEIVLADSTGEKLQKMSAVRACALLCALALARVDAGVLDAKDIKEIADHIEATLGTDLVEKLSEIWQEYQAIRHTAAHINRMYQLARNWEKLIKEESDSKGEEPMDADLLDSILRALGEAAGGAEKSAERNLENQRTQERWAEDNKEREQQQSEKSDNQQQASKVFGSTRMGSGPQPTGSAITSKRKPTSDEHAAAIRIGQELEKAKYRDRDKTEFSSAMPPGRMRSQAVVQNAAYRAKNLPASAQPFRRTARKHTDEPTLSIGMMTDVSGSMHNAMEPIAIANWVFSEASRRIDAKIASVYFGGSVTPGLSVGQHLDQIYIRRAPDGYEEFDKGFKALDGTLNLLNGSGARLLVVCSDGDYKDHQGERVMHWLKRCEDSGVGVLWLTFPSGWGNQGANYYCSKSAAELHHVDGSPTEASYAIGRTAAQALTRAGLGR